MNAARGLLLHLKASSLLVKQLSCFLILVAVLWPHLPAPTFSKSCHIEHFPPRNSDDEAYLHPLLDKRLYSATTKSIQYITHRQKECNIDIYDTTSLAGLVHHLRKLEASVQHLNATMWKEVLPAQTEEVSIDGLEHLKAVALALDDFRVVMGDISYEVTIWTATYSLDQARSSVRSALKNKLLQNGVQSAYHLLSGWPWTARNVVPAEQVEQARRLEMCSWFIGHTECHLKSLTGYLAAELVLVEKGRQVLHDLSGSPEILGAYRDRRCDDVCKILIIAGLGSLNSTLARTEFP